MSKYAIQSRLLCEIAPGNFLRLGDKGSLPPNLMHIALRFQDLLKYIVSSLYPKPKNMEKEVGRGTLALDFSALKRGLIFLEVFKDRASKRNNVPNKAVKTPEP